MTQAKKIKKPAFNMQDEWRNLCSVDQEIITNFFNAHNCAHLLYTLASEDAKKYISSCIMMQQDADRKEKKEV